VLDGEDLATTCCIRDDVDRCTGRPLGRLRRDMRAGARHPLGSGERLEQPREEQHQRGQ
jgi:hypothetical protein